LIPSAATVGGGVELLRVGEKVCATGAVFVVIKTHEMLLWVLLDPGVALVTRLPDGVVLKEYQNSLQHVLDSGSCKRGTERGLTVDSLK
jgi:hypothetical protein